jgi:catalase (peroxidase I)
MSNFGECSSVGYVEEDFAGYCEHMCPEGECIYCDYADVAVRMTWFEDAGCYRWTDEHGTLLVDLPRSA